MYLLDRHALCQVSWLVHVAASPHGYVAGEELEGHYFEDGLGGTVARLGW